MDEPAPRSFADDLALEPLGDGVFRAGLSGFGGLTLGLAAHAMGRTCPGRSLSAFQGTFLRAVDGEGPGEVAVETLREGRLFSHRRVRVARGERVLFTADATFTREQTGIGYQEAAPDAGLPAPEELPDDREVSRREGLEWWPGPVEFRWIGGSRPEPAPGEGGRWSVWARPRGALADEPALRAGALAFLADVHCDYAVRRRVGPTLTRDRFISLDQSIWVHADVPWDDWWLVTSDTPTVHAGRALNWRWIFDRDGRHLATLAQHALLRGPDPSR